MQNELQELNNFLESHNSFYLTIKSYTEYPETGFSPEDIPTFPTNKEVSLECNGFTLDEIEAMLKAQVDKAIFLIQTVFANYEKAGNYFLETQYKRLTELYKQVESIDTTKVDDNSGVGVEVSLDPEFDELTEDDITEWHYNSLKQYLITQKKYIESVLFEYRNLEKLMTGERGEKIGFKYGEDNV